jgi:Papain fold toxin 1, glutamine deamidase
MAASGTVCFEVLASAQAALAEILGPENVSLGLPEATAEAVLEKLTDFFLQLVRQTAAETAAGQPGARGAGIDAASAATAVPRANFGAQPEPDKRDLPGAEKPDLEANPTGEVQVQVFAVAAGNKAASWTGSLRPAGANPDAPHRGDGPTGADARPTAGNGQQQRLPVVDEQQWAAWEDKLQAHADALYGEAPDIVAMHHQSPPVDQSADASPRAREYTERYRLIVQVIARVLRDGVEARTSLSPERRRELAVALSDRLSHELGTRARRSAAPPGGADRRRGNYAPPASAGAGPSQSTRPGTARRRGVNSSDEERGQDGRRTRPRRRGPSETRQGDQEAAAKLVASLFPDPMGVEGLLNGEYFPAGSEGRAHVSLEPNAVRMRAFAQSEHRPAGISLANERGAGFLDSFLEDVLRVERHPDRFDSFLLQAGETRHADWADAGLAVVPPWHVDTRRGGTFFVGLRGSVTGEHGAPLFSIAAEQGGTFGVDSAVLASLLLPDPAFAEAMDEGAASVTMLGWDDGIPATLAVDLARELEDRLGRPVSVYAATGPVIVGPGRQGYRDYGYIGVGNGGHWQVSGYRDPDHDSAIASELASALSKGWRYAQPPRAGVSIDDSDRYRTLEITRTVLKPIQDALTKHAGVLPLQDAAELARRHANPHLPMLAALKFVTRDQQVAGSVRLVRDAWTVEQNGIRKWDLFPVAREIWSRLGGTPGPATESGRNVIREPNGPGPAMSGSLTIRSRQDLNDGQDVKLTALARQLAEVARPGLGGVIEHVDMVVYGGASIDGLAREIHAQLISTTESYLAMLGIVGAPAIAKQVILPFRSVTGTDDGDADPRVEIVIRPRWELVLTAYPWLREVNPRRGEGGDFMRNCVLAAMEVDKALGGGRADPVPAVAYSHASTYWTYVHDWAKSNKRGFFRVGRGLGAIIEAMADAPADARALVVVYYRSGPGHAFNAVRHPRLGVVFLDGQTSNGDPLRHMRDFPEEPAQTWFVPTTDGIEEVGVGSSPGEFIGADGESPSGAQSGMPPFNALVGIEPDALEESDSESTAVGVSESGRPLVRRNKTGIAGGKRSWEGEHLYRLRINGKTELSLDEAKGYIRKVLVSGPIFNITVEIKQFAVGKDKNYYYDEEAARSAHVDVARLVYVPIPEFSPGLMGVLPEEGAGQDAWRERAYIAYEENLSNLRRLPGDIAQMVPLMNALPSAYSWSVTDLGRVTDIAREPVKGGSAGGRTRAQHNVGVPLPGIRALLEYVLPRTARPEGKAYLGAGLAFGDELAALYPRPTGDDSSQAIAAEEAEILAGVTALAYVGAAAMAHHLLNPYVIAIKKHAVVLARHDMASLLAAAPGVEAFVEQNADLILARFESHFRNQMPDYDAEFRRNRGGDGPVNILAPIQNANEKPGEYLLGRMRQGVTFGMNTLAQLDATPDGEPQAVLEIRSLEARSMHAASQVEENRQLAAFVRSQQLLRVERQLARIEDFGQIAISFPLGPAVLAPEAQPEIQELLRPLVRSLEEGIVLRRAWDLPVPHLEVTEFTYGSGPVEVGQQVTGHRSADAIWQYLNSHLKQRLNHVLDATARDRAALTSGTAVSDFVDDLMPGNWVRERDRQYPKPGKRREPERRVAIKVRLDRDVPDPDFVANARTRLIRYQSPSPLTRTSHATDQQIWQIYLKYKYTPEIGLHPQTRADFVAQVITRDGVPPGIAGGAPTGFGGEETHSTDRDSLFGSPVSSGAGSSQRGMRVDDDQRADRDSLFGSPVSSGAGSSQRGMQVDSQPPASSSRQMGGTAPVRSRHVVPPGGLALPRGTGPRVQTPPPRFTPPSPLTPLSSASSGELPATAIDVDQVFNPPSGRALEVLGARAGWPWDTSGTWFTSWQRRRELPFLRSDTEGDDLYALIRRQRETPAMGSVFDHLEASYPGRTLTADDFEWIRAEYLARLEDGFYAGPVGGPAKGFEAARVWWRVHRSFDIPSTQDQLPQLQAPGVNRQRLRRWLVAVGDGTIRLRDLARREWLLLRGVTVARRTSGSLTGFDAALAWVEVHGTLRSVPASLRTRQDLQVPDLDRTALYQWIKSVSSGNTRVDDPEEIAWLRAQGVSVPEREADSLTGIAAALAWVNVHRTLRNVPASLRAKPNMQVPGVDRTELYQWISNVLSGSIVIHDPEVREWLASNGVQVPDHLEGGRAGFEAAVAWWNKYKTLNVPAGPNSGQSVEDVDRMRLYKWISAARNGGVRVTDPTQRKWLKDHGVQPADPAVAERRAKSRTEAKRKAKAAGKGKGRSTQPAATIEDEVSTSSDERNGRQATRKAGAGKGKGRATQPATTTEEEVSASSDEGSSDEGSTEETTFGRYQQAVTGLSRLDTAPVREEITSAGPSSGVTQRRSARARATRAAHQAGQAYLASAGAQGTSSVPAHITDAVNRRLTDRGLPTVGADDVSAVAVAYQIRDVEGIVAAIARQMSRAARTRRVAMAITQEHMVTGMRRYLSGNAPLLSDRAMAMLREIVRTSWAGSPLEKSGALPSVDEPGSDDETLSSDTASTARQPEIYAGFGSEPVADAGQVVLGQMMHSDPISGSTNQQALQSWAAVKAGKRAWDGGYWSEGEETVAGDGGYLSDSDETLAGEDPAEVKETEADPAPATEGVTDPKEALAAEMTRALAELVPVGGARPTGAVPVPLAARVLELARAASGGQLEAAEGAGAGARQLVLMHQLAAVAVSKVDPPGDFAQELWDFLTSHDVPWLKESARAATAEVTAGQAAAGLMTAVVTAAAAGEHGKTVPPDDARQALEAMAAAGDGKFPRLEVMTTRVAAAWHVATLLGTGFADAFFRVQALRTPGTPLPPETWDMLARQAGTLDPARRSTGSRAEAIAEVLRFGADGTGRRVNLSDLATQDQLDAIARRGGLASLDAVEALAARIAAAFTDPADGADGPPADVALTLAIPAGRTPDSIASGGQVVQTVATELKHPVFMHLEETGVEFKICW